MTIGENFEQQINHLPDSLKKLIILGEKTIFFQSTNLAQNLNEIVLMKKKFE